MARGSPIANRIGVDMEELLQHGLYTEKTKNADLLCRFNEARHADPDSFKKECPMLDTFFRKIFYPALNAQTQSTMGGEKVASPQAIQALRDQHLLSDRISKIPPSDAQEMNRLRQNIVKLTSGGAAQKACIPPIQKALNALLDRVNKPVLQAMNEFSEQMRNLRVKAFDSHTKVIQEIPSRPKTDLSNHDLLRGAANGGQGQGGEPPMDKHNGLDYRDVRGKDHQAPAPEPIRPTNPLEAEKQRRREEILQQREYEAKLAAKRGHSL